MPYMPAAGLLTPCELRFYRVLRMAVKERAHIFVKVRLADIVTCVEGADASHLRQISQKHIDFVLCDASTCRVIAGLELDDSSHDSPERQRRDAFVDEVLAQCGIALIHHPAQARYSISLLERQLDGAIRWMKRRMMRPRW
jgi:hypothetical protein